MEILKSMNLTAITLMITVVPILHILLVAQELTRLEKKGSGHVWMKKDIEM